MKQIKLNQGEIAFVDDKNYEYLSQYKWYALWNKDTKSYYAQRHSKMVNGKTYMIYMHREILGLVKGIKFQADHINHDTLDNRESNLRVTTDQGNKFNRRNVKGYCWNKVIGKYMARIQINKKQIFLGYFDKAKEACAAYLKAKKRYHKI